MPGAVSEETYSGWLDALYRLVNLREEDNRWVWDCGDPDTEDWMGLARQAAEQVGAPFGELLGVARRHGSACCDCELLLNCDPDDDEEDADA